MTEDFALNAELGKESSGACLNYDEGFRSDRRCHPWPSEPAGSLDRLFVRCDC